MSRLVCYFTEDGHTITCWQEAIGKSTINCTTCEDREKHEKSLKELNKIDTLKK